MSQHRADGTALAGARRRVERGLPVSIATALGTVALVPTVAVLLLRLVRNMPVGLPAVARGASPAVETLAAVVPALALVALAAGSERRAERVALAAVGVFALLGAVDRAAWLPAAAATLAGATTAVAIALDERVPEEADPLSASGLRAVSGPAVVAGLGLVALATSLAASAGIETTALRSVGAVLAFATLAVLPVVRSMDDSLGLGLWVVATLAVVLGAASAPFVAGAVVLVALGAGTAPLALLATSAPFVAGAVVLVALGAGTAPLALLAMGLGGGVATVVADARRHAFGPAVGVALLLFAGVPATLPRAVAFALGLVVLVREWDANRDAVGATVASTSGGVADA